MTTIACMPEARAPFLARILFADAPPHLQRRNFRQLCAAVIVGLIVAAVVGGVAYYKSLTLAVH